jgi:O-antigen ligase
LKRSVLDVLLLAGVVGAIAWGTFAFGAVYRWAYTPLAIACASIGATALVAYRKSGPPIGALAAALTAVATGVALQLIPLPAGVFLRISPAADAFLSSYDFAYRMRSANSVEHAISIAPDQTALGLTLFLALALFLMGTVLVLSARGARRVTQPLIALGGVLAFIGIVQAALLGDADGNVKFIYGFWQPRFGGNPFGPFVNRNHFAGWMLMMLPLAVASACAKWEEFRQKDLAASRTLLESLSTPAGAAFMLVVAAAALMSLAMLMTQSRSGLAAFVAELVLFGGVLIHHQSSIRARVAAAALVATVGIGAIGWAGFDMVARRLAAVRGDVVSPIGRLQAWSDGVRIVRDFPLTGTGLNTFGRAMMVYQTGEKRLHYQEAHNEYLQIAVEGGLLIGVPALIAIGVFIRDVRRRFREAPKRGTTYWLRVGAVVGLVSIALQSLVEFSLQMPGNAALFAAVAAVALHRSPNLRPSHSSASDSA